MFLMTYTNENRTTQKPFPWRSTVVFIIFVKENRPLVTYHRSFAVAKLASNSTIEILSLYYTNDE